ncbi:MAG: FGGY-family carbohydrate kinase [Thiobacillaceae bacterium]|nr:FGGY-family carbohydrate kinase [Thiobacillaceae bacterium]MCX7672639.1 FGGY-family carbohydrate kinase [Thiobacillaceae bacterium]MDW8323654.1 FGGY-family carbohydrate kinase [Burkholderiales bacterium]
MYLGIDFGTSGVRACVIAASGEIDAFERVELGPVEDYAAAGLWQEALYAVITQIPAGSRRRIAALALAATSGTVLACDEALNPAHPPLMYDDARAVAEAADIARAGGEDSPAAAASSGLAKVLWLKRQLGLTRARLYLNQADWLTARLSDRVGLTDYHNALKMGFDVERLEWPAWVEYLADVDYLPQVLAPGSAIACVARPRARELGLDPDCLVRAGTTDSIAAFLAAGVRAPGEAVSSLGSTLVLKLLSSRRVESGAYGVYSHWFGALWLAGGASNAGGRVLRQHFADGEIETLSRLIDPDTDSGLDYYPLPGTGERFPINDPTLPPRLSPRPSERHRFLHGLLEGLARIEALGYRRLTELGASALVSVTSCGGGAQNPVYTRIRARALGVPVRVAQRQEAAYGAALLARDGTDLFPQAPA